jgi:DNA-directed RNA polymerase subunit M/transcription elongation factor TFIIS
MDTATYICPNCQQDALLKGEAQFVCINCGYSTSVDDKAVSTNSSSSKADKGAAEVKKATGPRMSEKPVTQPAGGLGPLVTENVSLEREEAIEDGSTDMIKPEIDNKIAIERKLSKVVGEKRIEKAEQQLSVVTEASKGFVATYHEELEELFGPGAVRLVKGVALLAIILVLAFMIYTFIR